MMMDEYYEFQSSIEKKYGQNSIIMMMVGSFYEIYEYQDVGKARTMSSLLNIALTKKDKKKEVSKTNPYMCGFPSYCLHKYVDLLVRHHDYTVGIVDQENEETSTRKLKHRSLSKIYSPSIPYEYEFDDDQSSSVVETDSECKERVCMIFHVEKQKRNHLSKDERYFLSYVIANLSFGQLLFQEEEFRTESEMYEKLNQLFVQESVCERICLTSQYTISLDLVDQIKTHIVESLNSKYTNLSYQQKVLSKIFPQYHEHVIIQEMNLERFPMIVQQLTYLIDFIYDHCPLVLSKLQLPKSIFSNSYVHYNIRTYYELNVINSKRIDKRVDKSEKSLLDILDKTSTRMGSRYLRHLLFMPTYDTKILEERYQKIEFYLGNPDILSHYRQTFAKLCDVERKFRMMQLNRLSPYDMKQVVESIEILLQGNVLPCHLTKELELFTKKCHALWNIDFMEHTRNIRKVEVGFHRSFDDSIQQLVNNISIHEDMLHQFIRKSNGQCQIKNSQTSHDIHIVTTKRKWNMIKHLFDDVRIVEMKSSTCYVHSNDLDTACHEIAITKQQLSSEQASQFLKETQELVDQYEHIFKNVISFLQYEDVMTTFAHVSLKYHYTRPKIQVNQSSKYGIDCKGIRHAIIERIQENEAFVENDVELCNETYGILVYGLNSAGKSTLLKSVGLCVILAQIGMFVPSNHFIYSPFVNIFSKIYVLDDIYKGQSTFLYELSELKHILNQCDDRSLILCDELTSGTETYSATGLLASTLLHCVSKKSRVMFTTHLHTLASIPEIVDNQQISIQHFSVSVNDGQVIYNRILRDGMGDSLYGIEIADAVGFPTTFIKMAFDVRNKVAGKRTELVSNRRSRYNQRVIVDCCSRCGSTKDLHTHHIKPQQLSDKNGYIGSIHKNRAFNLEILCRLCHIREHEEEEKIIAIHEGLS